MSYFPSFRRSSKSKVKFVGLIVEQHFQRWTVVWIFSISVTRRFLSRVSQMAPVLSTNVIKKQTGIFETRPGEQKYVMDLFRMVRAERNLTFLRNSGLPSHSVESCYFFKQFGVFLFSTHWPPPSPSCLSPPSSHPSYATYEHLLECWEHKQIYHEANEV